MQQSHTPRIEWTQEEDNLIVSLLYIKTPDGKYQNRRCNAEIARMLNYGATSLRINKFYTGPMITGRCAELFLGAKDAGPLDIDAALARAGDTPVDRTLPQEVSTPRS
jgi:hypothetical protein